MTLDAQTIICNAKNVLKIEADAVLAQQNVIDQNFVDICLLLKDCQGRVVVTGMGKSGHIGQKIAATLASTGTPSFFMHPAEANHGDLGMITSNDVVLAISYSGENDEISTIIPLLKRQGTPVVAISGCATSTFAKISDYHLLAAIEEEACPLGLAPTASTTAALALGDAIAIVLLEMRGFTSEDFARSHPGGKLGRRLLLLVQDIMSVYEESACVNNNDTLSTALIEMTRHPLGIVLIVNEQKKLLGVFSEGDLRRTLTKGYNINEIAMNECMTRNPITITQNELALNALNLMEKHKISALPILDNQQNVIGVITMHHLLKARLI